MYFCVIFLDFAIICNWNFSCPFLSKTDLGNLIKKKSLTASPGGITTGNVGAMISKTNFPISPDFMISISIVCEL